jgi:hypothetical protein
MAQMLGQAEVILAVGTWPAVLPTLNPLAVKRTQLTVMRMQIRFTTPGPRHVARAVADLQPAWLLLAGGLDDDAVAALIAAGRATSPDLRSAMLGPPDDVGRCLRWTRRGCSVYLVDTSTAERVVRCLRLSCSFQLVVIDECFYDPLRRARLDSTAAPGTRESPSP